MPTLSILLHDVTSIFTYNIYIIIYVYIYIINYTYISVKSLGETEKSNNNVNASIKQIRPISTGFSTIIARAKAGQKMGLAHLNIIPHLQTLRLATLEDALVELGRKSWTSDNPYMNYHLVI